jgi:hypothetical protein
MTNVRDGRPEPPEPTMRLQTGADTPAHVRRQLVEEVRQRLLTGELDSELARVETALALLDGDRRA